MKKKCTLSFIDRYHKVPVKESNRLAYLAALIDGEGHVKVEPWGSIRLTIGMTHKPTIKWVHSNFGGVMEKPRKLPSGKKNHIWRLNDPMENLKLMLMLYPFMITKKKTVFKALKSLTKRLKKAQDFTQLPMFRK